MRSLDPSGWPSDGGHFRRGRHRARHTAAAPDSYPGDGYPADGDRGVSAAGHPYPTAAPDPKSRHRHRDEPPPAQERSGRRDAAAPGPAEPAEPTPKRRAGRNLPAAIAVGVALGSVVVAPLFLWKPAFLGVVIAAVAIGAIEMARAVRATGARPPLTPLLVGGTLMACLAWFSGPSALVLGLFLTVLATMVWRLADGPVGYHRDVVTGTFVAVYIPFLAGFAALLGAPDDGATRVLVTLLAVVVSDTAGYVAGVFLGRRPLAPSVSPKKTWEGLAGSLVGTAVGGAVALPLLLHVAWWWGALFGVAVSAAAVLGDLAESLLKRDLGVKDMSSLLPGHGGLMDRLDSILFAAPTAYLLLSVLAVPTQ